MKKYVLSTAGFKTKKEALAKIAKWEAEGTLKREDPPFIYEVVKKFKAVRSWRSKEVK